MSNIIDNSFAVNYKLWYCFDPRCSHYKIKMTIEDNTQHMIKCHNMKPPVGYESVNKNTNNKRK